MKVIFRLLMISIVFAALGKSVYAQGTTAVPFLELAPDSRAGGMGESGVALADNSAAIFWNPAGMAFLTGSELSFTHSNWLPQFNLDLFYDYRKNVELYPVWLEFLRKHQPKTIIFWGQTDIFFTPEGGEAYLKDLPDAEIHRLDAGHFAVEDHLNYISNEMHRYYKENVAPEK